MRSMPDAASAASSDAVTGRVGPADSPRSGSRVCATVGAVASMRTSTEPALAATGAPATTARYSTRWMPSSSSVIGAAVRRPLAAVDARLDRGRGALLEREADGDRARVPAVRAARRGRVDRRRDLRHRHHDPQLHRGLLVGEPLLLGLVEDRGAVEVPGDERGTGVPARVVESAVGGLAGVRRVADRARVEDDHGVAVLVDRERVVSGAELAGHVVGREQRVARLRPRRRVHEVRADVGGEQADAVLVVDRAGRERDVQLAVVLDHRGALVDRVAGVLLPGELGRREQDRL